MLQICMDMKLFLYGMIAAGIVGVWCLFWSNRFYNTAIRDLKRKDKPRGKWTSRLLEESRMRKVENADAFVRIRMADGKQAGIRVSRLRQFVNIALCACVVLLAAAGYGIYQYRYEMYVLWQHGIAAGCVAAGILMLRLCMNMTEKEEILIEGWKDHFENRSLQAAEKEHAHERAQPETFPATEQERAQIKKKKEKRNGQQVKTEDQIAQIEKGIREAAASDSRFAGVLTPEEETLFREVIKEYMR